MNDSFPEIIFEDDYLLILSKPSGWIVNDASTVGETPTIQAWLSGKHDFLISKSREFRSGIVHRLDKETSGVLVVAKNKRVFVELQRQFKEREVKKKYLALVHGRVVPREGSVSVPVGRLPWNRERFGVLPGGRPSLTRYKVTGDYRRGEEKFSLIELFPETGRTHQIRIHMKYLGHPLVSDSFYAGRKTARRDRIWCPRLFLHASEIVIGHPQDGRKINVKAKLPGDLQSVVDKLEPVV